MPNSSAYGALSVFFQYYARITHNIDVSRHAFTPVPAVDSTVITLVPFPDLPWPECDERWLFRLIKRYQIDVASVRGGARQPPPRPT